MHDPIHAASRTPRGAAEKNRRESPSFAVICNKEGRICQVIRDDASVLQPLSGHPSFLQLVSGSSKNGAREFLRTVFSSIPSFCRNIQFLTPAEYSRDFYCLGFSYRARFLIMGSAVEADLFPLMVDILQNGVLKHQDCPDEISNVGSRVTPMHEYEMYEDLTRMNNELVTAQRQLVEAQVEIEMQSDDLRSQIAEREKTERALHEASRKLSMLSSITRHDILNQITALRLFLELSREVATDPEVLGYIEKEDQAAETIQSHIEFTRYYQDIGVHAPQWRPIKETIQSAYSQLHPPDITFRLAIPDVEIFSDALIEKVFYNLMENSIRHGGSVNLMDFSVQESDDGFVITYRDNGCGIPAEDKPRIFRKGFGKHTGLGLFLSQEILAITGISIMETGTPGTGVQFEIQVPRDAYRFPASR